MKKCCLNWPKDMNHMNSVELDGRRVVGVASEREEEWQVCGVAVGMWWNSMRCWSLVGFGVFLVERRRHQCRAERQGSWERAMTGRLSISWLH